MKLLCVQSLHGIDLLNAQLTFEGRTYTVCGLAKEEYHNDLLWQWWILMEDENQIAPSAV